LIWEFYKYEDKHGSDSIAYDIVFNGSGRLLSFQNKPEEQRKAHCQRCGVIIPREVPRIKLQASFYYGSGYYCISCGMEKLAKQKEHFEESQKIIEEQLEKIKELEKISEQVLNDEWYEKKMALGKMLQVIGKE